MYYSQYHFGQQLDIIEDRYHEFKMFKDRDPKKIALLVLEYICAFMNSEGGTVYLGINDESIVHGLDVNQKWVDQFLCAVDN
jgi:predicted HTH transcriptional regulator